MERRSKLAAQTVNLDVRAMERSSKLAAQTAIQARNATKAVALVKSVKTLTLLTVLRERLTSKVEKKCSQENLYSDTNLQKLAARHLKCHVVRQSKAANPATGLAVSRWFTVSLFTASLYTANLVSRWKGVPLSKGWKLCVILSHQKKSKSSLNLKLLLNPLLLK